MTKLNKSLQSALLALAMMVAIPTSTTKTQQVPVASSTAVRSFVAQHKLAFVMACAWFIMDTRLNTRRTEKVPFKMDDLKQDFQDLLDSLNIFDAKLYKQLLFLFDKYIIGLPLKLDEAVRILPKDEDGEILKIKGKKLMQKPFGAYGLLDAYVIQRAKKFTTEVVAGAALICVYFQQPIAAWLGLLNKATKDLSGEGNHNKVDNKTENKA